MEADRAAALFRDSTRASQQGTSDLANVNPVSKCITTKVRAQEQGVNQPGSFTFKSIPTAPWTARRTVRKRPRSQPSGRMMAKGVESEWRFQTSDKDPNTIETRAGGLGSNGNKQCIQIESERGTERWRHAEAAG